MTWNYRVIYHDLDDLPWYGLHEVYYNLDGKVKHWTERPIEFRSETSAGLVSSLHLAARDGGQKPILKESDLEKEIEWRTPKTKTKTAAPKGS